MNTPRIPIAMPILDGREKEYVMECMDTTWISSQGKFIEQFEQRFAEYCGVKHAIATNNGTTAIHLALDAMGIGAGDEVIVPTLTYIASANAIMYAGATPVFVDSDPKSLTIDIESVKSAITKKTKAVMAVHLYGHPANTIELNKICRENNILLIEDAAEAHGAKVSGKRVGGLGECATFSFFGNKIITTGEGGMVTTDNGELAAKLRLLRGQGMDPHKRYWHPVIGYNYRMTNIAAAIGCAQMDRIDRAIAFRQKLAKQYDTAIKSANIDVTTPNTEPWAENVFWIYTALLNGLTADQRDRVRTDMDADGIETRPVFYPVHHMPPYRNAKVQTIVDAEHLAASGINLPTHEHVDDVAVQRIVGSLKAALLRI